MILWLPGIVRWHWSLNCFQCIDNPRLILIRSTNWHSGIAYSLINIFELFPIWLSYFSLLFPGSLFASMSISLFFPIPFYFVYFFQFYTWLCFPPHVSIYLSVYFSQSLFSYLFFSLSISLSLCFPIYLSSSFVSSHKFLKNVINNVFVSCVWPWLLYPLNYMQSTF